MGSRLGSPATRLCRNGEVLSLGFHCGFSRQKADLGMSSITERFIRGCTTPAQRDCLLPADVHFFAVSVCDLHLAQVSAEHIRAGLFDQDIDCHSVPSRQFYVETI